MDKKGWIIFSVVVIVILGGLVFVSGKNKIDVSTIDTKTTQTASEKSGDIADHVFGKKDSKVVLVEYGDFQCPACFGSHPNIQALSEKYKDQIAFVFRNFPLTAIHPNALSAAAAAEAAGLQGKYWEMNNSLYDNQDAWKSATVDERTAVFVSLAKKLGINTDTFTTDLSNPVVTKKINFDLALGKKDGVSGTPSFTINGVKQSDEIVTDTVQNKAGLLEAAIQAALKK